MNIGDLLDRGRDFAARHATNKRQALSVVAEIAARSFGLKAADVLDALLEREAVGSTGVGYGVAVPHARLAGPDAAARRLPAAGARRWSSTQSTIARST